MKNRKRDVHPSFLCPRIPGVLSCLWPQGQLSEHPVFLVVFLLLHPTFRYRREFQKAFILPCVFPSAEGLPLFLLSAWQGHSFFLLWRLTADSSTFSFFFLSLQSAVCFFLHLLLRMKTKGPWSGQTMKDRKIVLNNHGKEQLRTMDI